MGLFSSKTPASDDDADDLIGIWGGLGETRRPGRHRGGNLHGDVKVKPTGKHGKPVPAKGPKKK